MRVLTTLRCLVRFGSTSKRPVPSIAQIQSAWDEYSASYNKFDYCPQTLYYSLLYMMEVWEAKSILEVACGTGKLLPMAVNMKNPNTTYLATDLSPKMVELARTNLNANLLLYDSKLSFEQWLQKNNIVLQCANAEQKIPKPAHFAKFDRIICNCNAEKMLLNLHSEAQQGCLLGVSVWGNKDNNNLMTSIRETYLQAKIQLPEERSNFYLYKKVPALAERCGWEVVLNWEQNALFPALSANSQKYESFFFHQIEKIEPNKREEAKGILMKKIEKLFREDKKGVNFCCEMLILRKK